MAPVVARFSNMAVVAVVAVVTSGVYSAWVEVRALGGLTDSTYGLVPLAKLGSLLPILALGAVLVAWEVALLGVLLGLTAFLLSLSPPVRSP